MNRPVFYVFTANSTYQAVNFHLFAGQCSVLSCDPLTSLLLYESILYRHGTVQLEAAYGALNL